ncbi:hypothetical protein KIL84_000200 [Mauremys mutica]|uniref:Uncharacterized protein n=1 Tax=Mauremys mutica TaxID=74926 RepID=A0A9D3XC10_9SAUR|nr:hypothetical protein KIL84_000200 [Mauremys mutica]
MASLANATSLLGRKSQCGLCCQAALIRQSMSHGGPAAVSISTFLKDSVCTFSIGTKLLLPAHFPLNCQKCLQLLTKAPAACTLSSELPEVPSTSHQSSCRLHAFL